MSDPIRTARPDTSAISTMLRRYAHFEGDVPATPAPPETATPAGTNGGTGEEKKFTQADVDFHANKRAKDATEAARKKLLAELGIEDPDADKELLKAARAKREADKSEVERLAGETAKEKTRADQLQVDLDKERAERRLDRRNSAIKAKAANAHDLDAVLEWASRPANAALLDKTLDGDGLVVDKAVEALIAAARKDAAYLFKAGGVGSPSNSGGRMPQAGADVEKRASQTNQRTIRG